MFSLNGKGIVVTGGNAGIGEGCVRAFVEAGAKVVFCARREDLGKSLSRSFAVQAMILLLFRQT